MPQRPNPDAPGGRSSDLADPTFSQQPAMQLIYDTAPIGLAFLSPDCRYLQINQRLTEICGIPVADHIGRSVRDCVPALAESVERIVQSILQTGEPVIGVEVSGQRPDQTVERSWVGIRCAAQTATSSVSTSRQRRSPNASATSGSCATPRKPPRPRCGICRRLRIH